MLKISPKQLEKGEMRLLGLLSPSELQLEDDAIVKYRHDVEYDLTASLVSGGVLVFGTVSTALDCTCGRCLKIFEFKVCLDKLYHFYEDSALETEEIDLTPDIREDIVIALPQNFICSSKCRGICQVCGGDRNVTRCDCSTDKHPVNNAWDVLDKLVLDKNHEIK